MEVRTDKWLWCVRIFKTRNQATEECRAGKVKINAQEIKASHIVKIGEVIEVQIEQLKRILLVKDILDRRVSAKLAVDFVEDQTPAEEIERLRLARKTNFEKRDRGAGRPTKRERREIDDFKYK
ncbi:MAG: RNA-binding S4 domain-containing protein [Bacteroidales bacterium]